MTIASEITRIQTNIANAYTAASGKGATLPATENSDNLATCIASIPAGGGGSGKYQLLERIKDDSNNEIGTVSGFFTDANDVEYAVVCLDAQYRLASGAWCSNTSAVTNMPIYDSVVSANIWNAKETATTNTQMILDFCTAQSATSTACTHCRTKSFTIDGTSYSGQLPNMREVLDIVTNYNNIESKDTSASTYTSTNFSSEHAIWSSSQYKNTSGWSSGNFGNMFGNSKTTNYFICPVLEIPNN